MRVPRWLLVRSFVIAIFPTLGCNRLAEQVSPAIASPAATVVMLGTGNPTPDPDRSGPSVAVIANDRAYLVDAGPGLVRRAAAAARRGIPALEARRLDIVFVTHLHSDHTIGLPDLIFTGWTEERETPLHVYGPPGIKSMVDHLLAAYAEDINVRLQGPQPSTPEGIKVEVHEIAPGEIYRDSTVTVRAFNVPHVNWQHAYGYRFQAGGRVIVISGDTQPSEALADACSGCDLLLHEVYSATGIKTAPIEWQKYFSAAHTSTSELAVIAERAKPKTLLLYHQMYWGATDADLVREVNAEWRGPVLSAQDLGVY